MNSCTSHHQAAHLASPTLYCSCGMSPCTCCMCLMATGEMSIDKIFWYPPCRHIWACNSDVPTPSCTRGQCRATPQTELLQPVGELDLDMQLLEPMWSGDKVGTPSRPRVTITFVVLVCCRLLSCNADCWLTSEDLLLLTVSRNACIDRSAQHHPHWQLLPLPAVCWRPWGRAAAARAPALHRTDTSQRTLVLTDICDPNTLLRHTASQTRATRKRSTEIGEGNTVM